MWEIIIMALGSICSPIATYIIAKKIMKDTKDDIIDEVFDIIQTEDGQKFLYSVGALIGNGIKTGVGISGKGGKFKLQDVLMSAVGQFIQSKIPIISGQGQQSSDERFK